MCSRGSSSESNHCGITDSSNDEEDVFTDAHDSLVSPQSPVPMTRVEKVDDEPSHGEVPNTDAYKKRLQDAVPDEVAIVPDGVLSSSTSRRGSAVSQPSSPVPRTVVEKVDPDEPSIGDKPRTAAHNKRKADAVPDLILKASKSSEALNSPTDEEKPINKGSIPRTVITRVDSQPSHGEVPGTEAYEQRLKDAEPDIVEKKKDVPSKHISLS